MCWSTTIRSQCRVFVLMLKLLLNISVFLGATGRWGLLPACLQWLFKELQHPSMVLGSSIPTQSYALRPLIRCSANQPITRQQLNACLRQLTEAPTDCRKGGADVTLKVVNMADGLLVWVLYPPWPHHHIATISLGVKKKIPCRGQRSEWTGWLESAERQQEVK